MEKLRLDVSRDDSNSCENSTENMAIAVLQQEGLGTSEAEASTSFRMFAQEKRKSLPQPEKKADVLGNNMLKIQEEVCRNTGRIADALEELLILKKLEKGILPSTKLTKDTQVIVNPD